MRRLSAGISPLAVAERLAAVYGPPEPLADRPVLEGLVATLLSQNTTAANSARALANLRRRWPDWRTVATVDEAEIAATIAVAGLGPTRARRLRAILARLSEDFGEPTLEPLRGWSDEAALAYLRGLPGVGVKSAACVLLFSLGRAICPVDTHVWRLARRFGWVSEAASRDETFERLAGLIPPARRHELHVNLIRHGRRCCRARRPDCPRCPLLDLCPSYRAST